MDSLLLFRVRFKKKKKKNKKQIAQGEDIINAGLTQLGAEITNDEVEEEIILQDYKTKK
jgi:hypothetical protein